MSTPTVRAAFHVTAHAVTLTSDLGHTGQAGEPEALGGGNTAAGPSACGSNWR